jgi:hypothetical protein
MDYVIAIPSYKRAATIRDKTLALLNRHNVPKDIITIFVANSEEKTEYEYLNPGYTFVVGVIGMGAIRNFITNHYPIGTRIMNMDDDIKDFKQLVSGKLTEVESLHTVFMNGFTFLEEHGARLFGFYPVANAFFMKDKIRTDLRYIIGSVWGIINPGPILNVTLDDKEDVQRTLMMYVMDGIVVRYENYCPVTAYYKEKGGMMLERTKERIDASARAIVRAFPYMAKLKTTKKSGFTEVTLRDARIIRNFGEQSLTLLIPARIDLA